MSNYQYQEPPDPDEQTKSIEGRRAMLRRAVKRFPTDQRFHEALRNTLNETFIRRAAKNGVFICYTQSDAIFALNIAMSLRDAGVHAFMDELDVPDSAEWGDMVNKAMRDCGILLLVLSPDSVLDAEVQGERIYFLRKGKVIIPVIAKNCSTHGLETFVEPINFELDTKIAQSKLLSLLSLRKRTGVKSD